MRKILGLAAVLVLTSLTTAKANQGGQCIVDCSNSTMAYQGMTPSYRDCCGYFYDLCGAWGTATWTPWEGPAYQCDQA
jgi:hypothetical protein